MQIAVIFVHYRLGRYQPDAGALVLGGVQDTLLLFQHAVVTVLHHKPQHGGTEHLRHHLHPALLRRQLLAGVQGVFQQIAQNGAQVGLRHGKLPGQCQLPLHRNALLPGCMVVISGQCIHGGISAQAGTVLAELAFVLVQIAFQLLQLPGLGQSGNHMQMLPEVVPQTAGVVQIGL